MSEITHSARYRCAKCRHRVLETEKRCSHCGWEIDLLVAEERARLVDEKRRHRHRREGLHSRALLMVGGMVAIAAIIIMFLYLINHF